MNEHTQPTRCLLCRAEVYDQAALCPRCEDALDDTDSAVRAQQLDALTPVRREPMRAQRNNR